MIVVRALVVGVGLLVIWQAVVLVFAPPPFILPRRRRCSRRCRTGPDLWQVHAVTTLVETLIGLVAGTAARLRRWRSAMSFLPLTRRFSCR